MMHLTFGSELVDTLNHRLNTAFLTIVRGTFGDTVHPSTGQRSYQLAIYRAVETIMREALDSYPTKLTKKQETQLVDGLKHAISGPSSCYDSVEGMHTSRNAGSRLSPEAIKEREQHALFTFSWTVPPLLRVAWPPAGRG